MVTDTDDCDFGVLTIGWTGANWPESQRPRVFRGAERRTEEASSAPVVGTRHDPQIGGMCRGGQRVTDAATLKAELGGLGDQRVRDRNDRRGRNRGLQLESTGMSSSRDQRTEAQLGDGLRSQEDAAAAHRPDVLLEAFPSTARERRAEDPSVDQNSTHASRAT